MVNLKFYLTALQPNLLNASPSQSIGGYASSTEYSIASFLTEPLDLVTSTFGVLDDIATPYAIGASDEIMLIDSTTELPQEYGSAELLTVNRAYAGSPARFHSNGDSVFPVNKDSIFNGSLNLNGLQYRCIAVKNIDPTTTLHSLAFYIKKPSTNPNTIIRLAVEMPTVPVLYLSTTSGTSISIISSNLIGAYADNFFTGRLLVITDPTSLNYNQSRVIASFDAITGTLTFTNAFPYSMEAGKTYRIEQPPSQQLVNGRTSPSFTLSNITSLSAAVGITNSLSINIGGHGTDLLPNEVAYLWLARDVSSNTDKYVDNGFVFTAVFS